MSQQAAPSPRAPASASFRRSAWVLFGAAFAIRLLALWASGDAGELVKDEINYVQRANALLDGEGYLGSYQSWVRHDPAPLSERPQYPGAFQPPAYPTFLAAVLAATGRSTQAVQVVQCALSAATCVLLLALGRAWVGARAARVAGWTAAVYPNLIAFSHYFWTETFFTFVLLALFAVLFAGGGGLVSMRRAAAAGVVLAVGALTRSTLLWFAPVLVLFMALLDEGATGWPRLGAVRWRPALARGGAMIGVALALIAPWTIRNWLVHDGFVLIDTNAPYNLWRGNAPGAMLMASQPQAPRYGWPFQRIVMHPVANLNGPVLVAKYRQAHPDDPMPTDLALTRYASEVAWAQIRGRPDRALANAWQKLVDMWNPTSFLLRHFELGAYGPVSPAVRMAASAAAVVSYLAVALLAVVGLAAGLHDRRMWLVLAFVGYLSAVSALAFGLTRFRIPLMPLLMLPAAAALERLVTPRGRAATPSAASSPPGEPAV
ncbi:MAG: glycosyltransferase family 39 protein [Myxococcota bacterium]